MNSESASSSERAMLLSELDDVDLGDVPKMDFRLLFFSVDDVAADLLLAVRSLAKLASLCRKVVCLARAKDWASAITPLGPVLA